MCIFEFPQCEPDGLSNSHFGLQNHRSKKCSSTFKEVTWLEAPTLLRDLHEGPPLEGPGSLWCLGYAPVQGVR